METKVVLCVPFVYAHKHHIPHLMEFYAANKAKYDMELHWEMGRPLHQVQGNAVKLAREIGATHVLFTEHDQWGFPVDGLDVLLDEDKDVIGLITYMRKYPYLPMCMKKLDPGVSFITDKRNLQSFHPVDPVVPTDLITWGFTLVKTSVFERMEEAGLNPFEKWGTHPTDSYFCQYCEDLGITRWVHAGFCINHGDVPKEHVPFMRRMCDSINAHFGKFGPQALAHLSQNEDDPHGVVPYKTEAEIAIEEAAG